MVVASGARLSSPRGKGKCRLSISSDFAFLFGRSSIMLRKGLVGAALAVLALGSAAMADDSQTAINAAPAVDSSLPVTITQDSVNPIYGDDTGTAAPAAAPAEAPAAPAAPEGAIMWGLDQIGVGKFLEKWNINIGGYAEMGYFYDLTQPKNAPFGSPNHVSNLGAPLDRIYFPGAYKNEVMLNQLDIAIQKTVDASK